MIAALFATLLISCATPAPTQPATTRTYRLGFSAIPPRLTTPDVLATIEKWRPRADAAMLLLTPPFKSLLADTSASFILRREQLDLVNLYRSRGLKVVAMIDATNGIARAEENAELVALGRSIGEPAIQALYKEYAVAVDSVLHPDYIGVAMETNLVRAIAPPSLYANLKTMAALTATALRARGTPAKLFTSVQVETAWGKLPTTGVFAGVAQDRADFSFIDVLGLSSYPNLTTTSTPDELPDDYYDKLVPDHSLPMMVVEGGWASVDIVHPSTPAMQARYIRRQMELADRAKLIGLFQLMFTDIDPVAFGSSATQLAPFANMGLVTMTLADKPALAEWDQSFARPLKVP